ncbi:unnamed protein product [Heterobilharzia americana]|nr:unnamed protein product [Heterobilharzia americana]
MYDHHGNLLSHFQIPDVVLDQKALLTENMNKNLVDLVRWFPLEKGLSVDNKTNIRLHPLIYANPIVLTATISQSSVDDTNFPYTNLLHIPLNFISYPYDSTGQNESSSGVLIAAIVNIPRCVLLFHSSSTEFNSCVPYLKVLEIDWLSSKMAPYIFSSPTLKANLVEETHVKDHTQINSYSSFITTLSGNLHIIKISLLTGKKKISHKDDDGNDAVSVLYSMHISPMTLSCIPAPCPSEKTNRSIFQSNNMPRSCCLLLDTHSCLRLVHILPIKSYYYRHPRIYWTYCPIVSLSAAGEHGEQTSQVKIVPGCKEIRNCPPWCVYSTPDGYAHAVDIETGLSAPGYPIQLRTTVPNVTDLSISTGVLYQREDSTYWMLFTDVHGNLIHLRLHNPLVIFHYDDLLQRHHSTSNRSSLPLQLIPVVLKSSKLPAYLLLSSQGVLFLKSKFFQDPIIPTSLLAYSKSIDKTLDSYIDNQMNPFQFISVEFVNDHFEPINSIILDENKKTINYLIKDCSFHSTILNESRLAKRFLVRLITSFGVPISQWSNVYVTPHSGIQRCGNCDCSTGFLSVDSLPLGPYRGELYLSVIDSTNGYFIRNYRILSSDCIEISAHTILEIGVYQTELIISLIYLPGVYLILGLKIMHWFSTKKQIQYTIQKTIV